MNKVFKKYVIRDPLLELYWKGNNNNPAFTAYIDKAKKFNTKAEADKELLESDIPDGKYVIDEVYRIKK